MNLVVVGSGPTVSTEMTSNALDGKDVNVIGSFVFLIILFLLHCNLKERNQ